MLGAGVILHYRENDTNYVLVGNESRYLQDTINQRNIKHPEKDEILTKQTLREYQCVESNNKYAARAVFQTRARLLAEQMGECVRFDTPIVRDNNIYYSHYRVKIPMTGILKGQSQRGEFPIHTAIREVKEELGFELDIQPVPFSDYVLGTSSYTLYNIRLTRDLVDSINNIMDARNNDVFGELFDLRFVSFKDCFRRKSAMTRIGSYAVREISYQLNRALKRDEKRQKAERTTTFIPV